MLGEAGSKKDMSENILEKDTNLGSEKGRFVSQTPILGQSVVMDRWRWTSKEGRIQFLSSCGKARSNPATAWSSSD